MMKKLTIYTIIVAFLSMIVMLVLYIIKSYGEDESFIYYYVESGVKDNILFMQFLNNEIKAYDFIEDANEYSKFDYYGKEFYIKDLYVDYWENNASDSYKGIDGIRIMSRDMDEDGKSELLIMIEYHNDEADLHVFEEKEGKLYAWEYWRNLRTMRSPMVEIYDTGLISRGGSGNESYTKYNSDGKIENVLMYSFQRETSESGVEGEFVYYYELIMYDNGNVKTRLEYEEYNNRLTTEIKITDENQVIKAQCIGIFEQIKTEHGESDIIDKVKYLDEVEVITFSELTK